MRVLRVLRGIAKTAMAWSVAWVPLSLIPFGIGAFFGGYFTPRILVAMVVSQALAGAINGAVFATVLALRGRRRTFESLSLPWIASCGAIGGVVFPVGVRALLLSTVGIQMPLIGFAWALVTNAALGAGLAAISLALARRAPALSDGSDGNMPSIGSGEPDEAPEKATRAFPNIQPMLMR